MILLGPLSSLVSAMLCSITISVMAILGRVVAPGFNAEEQYISTTGEYKFVPPRRGDIRGPCPGLNAMANHGYLPHNGVATVEQYIEATNRVFGMGLDLAGFLSEYGAMFVGNLVSWSIGGPTSLVPPPPFFGTPQGLSFSHNKYETDTSPIRGDLYQHGNAYLNQVSQFSDLYRRKKGRNANYDLQDLFKFRSDRMDQCIRENRYCSLPPFAGIFVAAAAYTFMYRFMANKSAEHPEGVLNRGILKSFYSITGTEGNFVYTPGHERIPDNWYKRAIGDEYTIPFFLNDVVEGATKYPKFLDVGSNSGTTNSFTGVNFADIFGGAANVVNLLRGDNLPCFIYLLLLQPLPDVYLNLEDGESDVLNLFGLPGLSCPQLAKFNFSAGVPPGNPSSTAPAGHIERLIRNLVTNV